MLHPVLPKKQQNTRWDLTGHLPAVVWLSGPSGSGKTTMANRLEQRLLNMNIYSFVLDEESLAVQVGSGSSLQAMLEKVALLFEAGLVVVVAMKVACQANRDIIRQWFPGELFYEIYLDSPACWCAEQSSNDRFDPSQHYEPHQNAKLTLDLAQHDEVECTRALVELLTEGGCLDRRVCARH